MCICLATREMIAADRPEESGNDDPEPLIGLHASDFFHLSTINCSMTGVVRDRVGNAGYCVCTEHQ